MTKAEIVFRGFIEDEEVQEELRKEYRTSESPVYIDLDMGLASTSQLIRALAVFAKYVELRKSDSDVFEIINKNIGNL
jgi:hypothetical protein